MTADEPPTYRVVTCPRERCDAWAFVPAGLETQHRRDWQSTCRPARVSRCARAEQPDDGSHGSRSRSV